MTSRVTDSPVDESVPRGTLGRDFVFATPRRGIGYRRIGKGPSLVLLHGGAGSWRHWERNIDALSAIRTMFLPDLPGFGESTDVAADISVDAYVELVLKAIDEMVGDGEHLDIVGFSFGGQIAAAAAVGLGERARRVALLSPSGFDKAQGRVLNPPRPDQSDPSEEAEREYRRQMLLAVMFADAASADDEAVDIQHYNMDRARLNNRRISRSGRLVSMLKQIRCPVLVIYGDHDAVAYPSPEARIEQCRAARPDIRTALVANAGHWLQYERPDALNRLLIDFLDSES